VDREQLASVLWLRWRLTRNQWRRSGGLGAVLAAIMLAAIGILSVTSFAGALLVGVYAMGQASPRVVTIVWLVLTGGFLLFWLIGLIQDLQRSESIDLQRLMHLPVALGQIFVVNYLASHLALAVVIFAPAMIGMAIGLAISRGPGMLLLAPLALAMVFMITAWTYCLRGWLATLMSNPRRRRTMIMGITMVVIVIAQLPNLYFNVIQRADRPARGATADERARQRQARDAAREREFNEFLTVQRLIPPLWVPVGAGALAQGRAMPAVFGTLGCLGIGALGLRRAYRSTRRFYQGESGGRAPARQAPSSAATDSRGKQGRLLVERSLRGVPEQAAAVALATWQSMLRAPEVKMQFATSFVVSVLVGGSFLFRAGAEVPDGAKPFIATAVVVFALFTLVQFLANQFGLDRDGFRALLLSPADRRLILFGKNLACFPAGALSAIVLLAIVSVVVRLSPVAFVASVCQLVAGLLMSGIAGNLLSILVPYRIQAGSMKPTKMPGLAMIVMLVCQLMFPFALTPLFAGPLAGWLWARAGGPPAAVVNLCVSVALTAIVALAYKKTLAPLGRLLHRRETAILTVVSVEVD
jgi:hypothetical protein